MVRILHVAEVLKGGTASYLDELLHDQHARVGKENLAVLVPQSQVNCLDHAADIPVFTFPDAPPRALNIFRLQRAIRQVLKRREFELIHVHGTFAGIGVRTLIGWRHARAKIIYCAHGWAFDRESARWKKELIGYVEKLLARLCDRIVCISDFDARSALQHGIPAEKLTTIRNGIADKRGPVAEVHWPPAKRRFLFAGRFDRQKGADLFFKAMRLLGSDYHAFAIGDFSADDGQVDSVPDNVTLTGWLPRETVQAYMRACDLFVMPSRWEGFGLSALEAMRAGCPVIASHVGGLVELVQDGLTGRLVMPNSAEALAAAMSSISDDEVSRMGKAARARFASLFTAQRLNREIYQLYQSIAGTNVFMESMRREQVSRGAME